MGTPIVVDSDELAELRDDAQLARALCLALTGIVDLEGLAMALDRMQIVLGDYAARSVLRAAAKKARATC